MKEFEHLITKRVRSIYRRALVPPIVFLLLLILLWGFLDMTRIVFPEPFSLSDPQDYATAELKDLRFTGYTESILGQTNGYYYYTTYPTEDANLLLVLLSPRTCEQGLPRVDSVTIRCKVLPIEGVADSVLSHLSDDLSWTDAGIRESFYPTYLNEPDYHYPAGVALMVFLLLFGAYAVLSVILSLVYLKFPHLSPMLRPLARYGNAKDLLKKAEEELLTLPQLATEDLFITEHFFIEVADRNVAVIPIKEIVWVYKHSTLHKFLWYHFSISYTLSITATKRLYLQCPKNLKSDIDGIIDYLAEANHKILVGFSEENRLKVQEIEGTPLQLDRLLAFLNRRI